MSAEGVGTLRLPEGCPCVSSVAQNFAYYEPPMIESVQSSFKEIRVMPSGGVSTAPYTFKFDAQKKGFMCLNTLSMYVRAKVVKGEGETLGVADKVLLANNGLHSMFSNVQTTINGISLNPQSAFHIPHKSMIESLLSHEGTNNGAFRAWRFESEYDQMDEFDRPGFKDRLKVCAESKEFDVCGPVCADFLRSDNHLAPGNTLKLKFTRSADAFVLNSEVDETYKLVIKDIYLQMRILYVFENALPAVVKGTNMQRYISTYTELRMLPLPAGQTSIKPALYTGGNLPKQIVIGMISTAAATGSYGLNPYNFQHFDIKSINLKMNGLTIPEEALKPNFDKFLFLREYNHLYMNTGKYRSNAGNSIRYDQFTNGHTLFPFDLTPDMCNGFHLHAGNQGTLHLEISWIDSTKEAITIVVYAAFDQVVMISKGKLEVSIF